MIDPYRMVVVNLIASLVLLAATIFYRFIYPRKKINLFVLLVLVSCLPIISLLRRGDYESGDFNIHVYRAMAFYNSLKEGILMPSWPAELNATFGYPLFIFLNPLPYYLIAFFHSLGFSFISGVKLLFGLSYILSGIGMFVLFRRITKNETASFVSAVFYLYSPYHLVDLHFRATVGELLVFTFLPLAHLSFLTLYKNKTVLSFLTASFTTSLLFLSHQAGAVFSLGIIFTYLIFLCFVQKKINLKNITILASAILFGMLLSVYTWFPHLYHTKYTYSYLLSSQTVSFPKFAELFISPWRNGFLFQGPKGDLSALIGYSQLFSVITSVIIIFKKKLEKAIWLDLFFWNSIFFTLLFLMTSPSSFLWKIVPILNTTQFATRLLLPLAFCTSMIAGYIIVVFGKKKTAVILLTIITISYTILNWGHRRVIPQISDLTLAQNLPKSTAEGEAFCCMGSPKWVDIKNPWQKVIPKNPVEILRGNGEIKALTKKSTLHTYAIFARTDLTVKENTLYFPGWKILDNKKEIIINPSHADFPGIITFSIPKGPHYIEVVYEDLLIHKMTKIISALGLLSVMAYFLTYFLKKVLKKIY